MPLAMRTFSRADNERNNRKAWNTKPRFRRSFVFPASESVATSRPNTYTFPDSGPRRQPSSESIVVFPLPDGPMINVNFPLSNVAETSRSAMHSACREPYFTDTFSSPR
jgi:hypothetical protein